MFSLEGREADVVMRDGTQCRITLVTIENTKEVNVSSPQEFKTNARTDVRDGDGAVHPELARRAQRPAWSRHQRRPRPHAR